MSIKPRWYFLLIIFLLPVLWSFDLRAQSKIHTVDICIYGGSSAGVIAAYTAKKLGKTVLLIEPGKRLGGLTSGGLGQTDIGNKYAVTGLSLDFYRRIGAHYGNLEQWTFEPKVAKQIFDDYIKEAKITVLYEKQLVKVDKEEAIITAITIEDAEHPGESSYQTVKAKEFLDCTYEGDLVAKAGVSYTIGREANSEYNETYNGVQLMNHHQFPDGIDPYKTPGDPSSGLLWGISNEKLAPAGSGDKKVQSYNIRVCLTKDPANRIAVTRPDNYDSTRYELLLRLLQKQPVTTIRSIMTTSKMPHDKTDINNNGAFSTDMIGESWSYPEADYATRKQIQNAHDDYTKGFFYFVGHDERMPKNLRNEMLQFGYPKDEYHENNHWTPQMYVREARRMVGDYVMTQANCVGDEVVDDGVGLAAYTMDSHNCQRLVVNDMVKNEGNVEIGGFDPYPISYRALIPKPAECTNLLVPVCLSASHIAYGSIRMEPVFMVLGQSCAAAATMAIDQHINIQDVPVKQLQHLLAVNPYADGRTADILVDNKDSASIDMKGVWGLKKRGGYGPDFLIDSSYDNGDASVQFTPDIVDAGLYEIYTYYPKLADVSEQSAFTIFDGRKSTEKMIKKSEVEVVGQTSGEWLSLGKYSLEKGKSAHVEISNKNADGVVIADAILFVRKQ